MKFKKAVFAVVMTLMVLNGVVLGQYIYRELTTTWTDLFSLFIWLSTYIVIVIKTGFYGSSFLKKPPPPTQLAWKNIYAIIPAYNEEQQALADTIAALLHQSYPLTRIYVVDDGSKPALPIYQDERVICLRQENQGKRHAQVHALMLMDQREVDYIVTVDSDSVVEETAIEKLVQALEANPQNNAVTGFVLTRNFRDNLMTRVADLNISLSCMTSRPIRSYFGALETTSGALSIYRSAIFFDNYGDYLTSGTYSDDRQMCFYSLLTGYVRSASNILVYSAMPTTLKKTLKQRLRWAKGSWKFFPKQMEQLSFKKKLFPIVSMIQVLLFLTFAVYAVYLLSRGMYRFLLFYFFTRSVLKGLQTLLYVTSDERMSSLDRLLTLLIVAPFELLFDIILGVLKFIALFLLKDTRWSTR